MTIYLFMLIRTYSLEKNIFTQLRPSSPDKTSARLFLFSNPPSLVNTPWAPILTKPTLSLGGTH